jgi:hypothetical protein
MSRLPFVANAAPQCAQGLSWEHSLGGGYEGSALGATATVCDVIAQENVAFLIRDNPGSFISARGHYKRGDSVGGAA